MDKQKQYAIREYNPRKLIFWTVISIVFVLTSVYADFNPLEILLRNKNPFTFIGQRLFPIDFSLEQTIFEGLLSTISIGLGSCFIGAILAFIAAIFGSSVVSPLGKYSFLIRALATFLRNIPALVWAFILFSSIGIGTGVAFIALIIVSFAFLTRAFIEVIENVSGDILETFTSAGSTFFQKIVCVILPLCIKSFISWFLYRLEINIRSSTIIGMVGGGGIGLVLVTKMKLFKYRQASWIILLIAVTVILVNLISNFIRKSMLENESNNEKKESYESNLLKLRVLEVVIVVLSVISIVTLKIDWVKIIGRLSQLSIIFRKLFTFDFKNFSLTLSALAESISIAFLSTVYSLIIGFFLAIFAANNIVRSRFVNLLAHSVFTFLRAVPTTVWVLIALVCYGLGPVPGIIGLGIHSTAFFAKVIAESFEEVPLMTIEALEAAGAGKVKIFLSAIVPSAARQLVAWLGLRFETNFSESAILGIVGAGGVGYVITTSMNSFNYGIAGLAIILIFIFAYCVELTFTYLKGKM